MANTLLSIFPNPDDLLALDPENLAGVLLEIVPGKMQNAVFNLNGLEAQLFTVVGTTYPPGVRQPVQLALAEALSWLVSQGLLLIDPNQPAHWYVLTRRGRNLRSRADVEAYRKGRDAPR